LNIYNHFNYSLSKIKIDLLVLNSISNLEMKIEVMELLHKYHIKNNNIENAKYYENKINEYYKKQIKDLFSFKRKNKK